MRTRKKRGGGGGRGRGGSIRRRYPLKTGVVTLASERRSSSNKEDKKKKLRAVSNAESFEDTRLQIRDFIAELERKAETKTASKNKMSPKKHLRTLSTHHHSKTQNKNKTDPKSIREEYAALQQSSADEALRSYTNRLEHDMNREIQAQVDHEDVALKRETDAIDDRFESDVVALKEFEQSIVDQIRELEVLKREASLKLQELQICRDRCVDKCKERHRVAIEKIKLELQEAMNLKIEEKREEIRNKLASVLTPSIW